MEFIDTDFPRVPVPKNKNLFLKIGEFGAKLINLHLMKNVPLEAHKFVKGDNSVVGKVTYDAGRVYINDTSYFENVSPEVWEFNMGGYQVLAKYLKDRKGRDFDFSEQSHYQKIISVLNNTLKLTDTYDDFIKEQID